MRVKSPRVSLISTLMRFTRPNYYAPLLVDGIEYYLTAVFEPDLYRTHHVSGRVFRAASIYQIHAQYIGILWNVSLRW
jgi:hypothetical protein